MQAKKKVVLLIEDNATDYYILRKKFENTDIDIVWVDNFGAAMDISTLMSFDLTLLDYQGVNHFHTIEEQLKRLKGDVWVISGAIIPQSRPKYEFHTKDQLPTLLNKHFGIKDDS